MAREKCKGQGKMTYVPKPALLELRNIMLEKELKKSSKAFVEMANYSEVGRAAERIFFGNKKKGRK